MNALRYRIDKCLGIVRIFRKDSLKRGIVNKLRDAEFLRVTVDEACDVHHHIGKNPYVSLISLNLNIRNSRILDPVRKIHGNGHAGLGNDLSRVGIDNITRKYLVSYTVTEHKLLIELISSDFGKIVSSRIKEHGIDEAFRALNRQRLARTYLLVKFKKTFLIIGSHVFTERCHYLRLVAEQIENLLIGPETERTKQNGDGNFSCTVHAHKENIIRVCFIL